MITVLITVLMIELSIELIIQPGLLFEQGFSVFGGFCSFKAIP